MVSFAFSNRLVERSQVGVPIQELLQVAFDIAVRNEIHRHNQVAGQNLKKWLNGNRRCRDLRIERIPPEQLRRSTGADTADVLNQFPPLFPAPHGDDAASGAVSGVGLSDDQVRRVMNARDRRQSAPEFPHLAKCHIPNTEILRKLPSPSGCEDLCPSPGHGSQSRDIYR